MLAGGVESDTFNETAGALFDWVLLINTDQSTEWEILDATLPSPLQAQSGVLLGDTLLCMGGLDLNDLSVTALHIINSTS